MLGGLLNFLQGATANAEERNASNRRLDHLEQQMKNLTMHSTDNRQTDTKQKTGVNIHFNSYKVSPGKQAHANSGPSATSHYVLNGPQGYKQAEKPFNQGYSSKPNHYQQGEKPFIQRNSANPGPKPFNQGARSFNHNAKASGYGQKCSDGGQRSFDQNRTQDRGTRKPNNQSFRQHAGQAGGNSYNQGRIGNRGNVSKDGNGNEKIVIIKKTTIIKKKADN